jgi:phenylpropionate dioxygenase-like ring-hydroxylating dioxygenase large terminal subunit
LKDKPISVRLLGEDLVLFRGENGKAAALVDRCPHRGTMLSRGRVIFPGTLSCGYHGWTFNGRGECVAAIVEGPESRLPGKVRVKAYPVEERLGLVWAYMGEGEPPPLEADLPPELLEPGVHPLFAFTYWNCEWRNVTENYPDILHAPFVHRTHIEVLFNKVPAWGKIHVEMLPDGRGLHVRGQGGTMQAEYPGLGKFPRRLWWRVLRRRYKKKDWSGASTAGGDVRMPGNIVVKIREPFFGIHMANIGWPVPVDEKLTRHLNLIVTYPKNALQRLALDLWYRAYFRPIHRRFVGQDRRLIEVQNYRSPESLSATDVGLIQWRRLATTLARQRMKEPLSASAAARN